LEFGYQEGNGLNIISLNSGIPVGPGGKTEKETEDQITQLKKWNNQHVTIDGKLGRFMSALVSPNVFIEITTIKKD